MKKNPASKKLPKIKIKNIRKKRIPKLYAGEYLFKLLNKIRTN